MSARVTADKRVAKVLVFFIVFLIGENCWGNDLEDALPIDDSQQHDNNGNDQKNVDKSTHGVRGHQTQHPKDDQNDSDGGEHGVPLRLLAGWMGRISTGLADAVQFFQDLAMPLHELLFSIAFADAIKLLNLSGHPVALACHRFQMVVSQLAPLLFGNACELFPVAFNLIPVHGAPLCVDAVNKQTAVWRQRADTNSGQDRDLV